MTSTQTVATEAVEYGLMIDWEDGESAEFVPATSFDHAEEMARKLYSGRTCWTVGREARPDFWPAPWRYARRDAAYLTDEVAR
jgi:hypothetical protein